MQQTPQPQVISIKPGTIILIFAILLLGIFFYNIREIVPLILASLVFAAALEPAKEFLMRYRIPATVAMVILYLIFFALLFFLLYLLVPIMVTQYQSFLKVLPTVIDSIVIYLTQAGINIDIDSIGSFIDIQNPLGTFLQKVAGTTTASILSVFSNTLYFIIFLVLTFLFAVRSDGVNDVFRVLTPKRYEHYVLDLWIRTRRKIGLWFQGQLILGLIMGVLSFLFLYALDIPHALFLAVIVGVLEIIPVFGPVLAAIPAVIVSASLGWTTMLLVILVYTLLQQLENNLIYPIVINKIAGVSSVLVILALLIGASLIGFVGIVIAVPVVSFLQELYTDIETGRLRSMISSEVA
ncbi:MAG: AI-2E family transporter [Alphaproteobacteria bacterium]|nr:AI-2E family transporter [Alphaproteobacteria bacterium]